MCLCVSEQKGYGGRAPPTGPTVALYKANPPFQVTGAGHRTEESGSHEVERIALPSIRKADKHRNTKSGGVKIK